ncbi:GntR family transcriptional regulator [Phreatobacter sp.]|uniref:GntR family transcriptional regulator n=1 Tax=Phreatobacter sp. TaxID=1966341 RepID=UPI003F7188CE
MVLETTDRPRHTPGEGRGSNGGRLRTLPEQIAEQLGMAIVEGAYAHGERIVEQKLSDDYGVSRGPVRDALRALETRGLVRIYPRRGAYAVPLSLDLLADMFNIRARLLGLAACYLARSRPPAGLSDLKTRAEALVAAVDDPDIGSMEFAMANGRLGAALYRHCGSDYLADFLRDQGDRSIWGLIWRQRPLDFLTTERRRESATIWTEASLAIHDGNEAAAERAVQAIMYTSRDQVIATLGQVRSETVSRHKLIQPFSPSARVRRT